MAQRVQPRHRPGFLAILALGLLSTPAAWAQDGAHKPAAATAESMPKAEKPIHTGIAGSFLSGRFAKENQDLKQAAAFINESLAKDPLNLHLRQEALRLNLLAGNMDIATGLAKKLVADGENDPLIASLLMLDAVKAGDYAHAKTIITNAPSSGLFGLIQPVMLQWLAIGAGDVKGAVNLQAAIDKSGFFAPFLVYHSALMNDVLGHGAEAEIAYRKANADTAVAPYRVVQAYANFEARGGKWDEAQKIFDGYAKANPNSSLIPEKLAGGEPPKPLVANARDGLAEVFFTAASLLFSDESAQDTFLYLRIALDLRPDLPPGQLMLANLYEQVGDYNQAIKTYDGIAEDTVFFRRAQVRKALNYESLGDKAKAVELLDTVSKRYPEDTSALITKGDLLRDDKDFSGAATAYGAAITRSEPLNAADWPLLYARGISYERAGDWDSAEKDFQRALVLSPNQPDVLNYLGYTWLTLNKNITKAREYLDIAASARPDDGNIADSVGWAHYLSGDFQYAATQFERAIQLMPDDASVNEHLGDAYWRIGRQTEARYQWERALASKPEKDVEQGLRAKLENGLPPFVAPPSETAKARETKADASGVTGKTQVQ